MYTCAFAETGEARAYIQGIQGHTIHGVSSDPTCTVTVRPGLQRRCSLAPSPPNTELPLNTHTHTHTHTHQWPLLLYNGAFDQI